MGIERDVSPYGSQTVIGPGWPNVDEEALAAAAAQYAQLATKLTGSVVPQQQSQLTKLAADWRGTGALAAGGEATTMIAGHEANAAQAAAIAAKLQAMEVTVAKTKALVNATAMETQQECMAIQASAAVVSNTEELIQARIKLGLSQNIAYVTANTTELASTIGATPNMPQTSAPPGAGMGSQQAMQMLSQMGQMAGQIPGMLSQLPQQMTQPLQQLAQPLQQLTSMFSQGGGSGSSSGVGSMPFAAFSNHPLAGGSGAGGGAGMVRAASLPGSGGIGAQTPLMANLVGNQPGGAAAEMAGASTRAAGGVAPVGAGMGGMGMMGGHGQGRESGGTASSLALPPPLEYDTTDGDVDDDW